MLGPVVSDASRLIAYLTIFILTCFTLYIYYTFMLALCVKGENQREKDHEVRRILLFIQRPLRLRRYKTQKFIYPVYYLTRRMILALVCVYMQDGYATQWLIWVILSLGMLFILAKIRPFGDVAMNFIQFINESFIFMCLILLMPLANNLTDLNQRNNVGWCLYGVLITCIIFNILILLIRCCTILCQYVKVRNDLVELTANVKIPAEENSINDPF